MRALVRFVLAAAALAAGGCVVRGHGPPMPPMPGMRVMHAHGLDCGHAFSGGVWITMPVGHAHGHGCGHFVARGAWHGPKMKRKG